MPLSTIKRFWDRGSSREPLESNVARILHDVGGYLLYREAYYGTEPMVARVHHYKTVGSYPWRVALRESGAAETWREVAQHPTFREADAEARRHVRQRSVAIGKGDEWCAYSPWQTP